MPFIETKSDSVTGLIVIDESGDLGNGSRFFVMVAIVTRRSRTLLKTSKSIPKSGTESKFYNSNLMDKTNILTELKDADVQIVYVAVDKHNSKEPFNKGNDLYRNTLKALLEETLKVVPCNDLNVTVDESRSIKIEDLRKMTDHIANKTGKNIKKCLKASSESNKCVQIVDFVAGSIWTKYEKRNDYFYKIFEEKISVARESLRPP